MSALVVCVRAEFKFRNEEHILNTNTHTHISVFLSLYVFLSLSVFSDDVAGWMADAGARIGSNKYERRRITYICICICSVAAALCVRCSVRLLCLLCVSVLTEQLGSARVCIVNCVIYCEVVSYSAQRSAPKRHGACVQIIAPFIGTPNA